METLTDEPMGMIDRLKTAGKVLMNGNLPNPLAEEPKDKDIAALVKELNKWCVEERKFWAKIFERINQDIEFAAGRQWGETLSTDGRDECYTANIVQRHLGQKEAMLYAKNPTFAAKRRERMEYKVWDGDESSLAGARVIVNQSASLIQTATEAKAHLKQVDASRQAGKFVDPDAVNQLVISSTLPPQVQGALAIVQDFEEAKQRRKLEEDCGKTLNILFANQLEEQNPPFDMQMKQLVTRVNTCGVGYLKVCYRRETETYSAEDKSAVLKQKLRELSQPDAPVDNAAAAELMLMLREMQSEQETEVKEEGLVIDFPTATSIIVDRNCRNLRGFVGARRIAHEMLMSVADVEAQYDVNLRDSGAIVYHNGKSDEDNRNQASSQTDDQGFRKVCVFEVYDKKTKLCYTICDGVKHFIKEPHEPKPKWDFFWNIIPLVFRPVEVERNDPERFVTIYPESDVRLLMPIQKEKNRSREAFREHRIANRPRWVVGGALTDADDLQKLSLTTPAGAVMRLASLLPNEKISDRLQAVPTFDIDPKVYDTSVFDLDAMQVIGTQPSNLGQQLPGEKATGQAIAQGDRVQQGNSNVDDIEKAMDLAAEAAGLLLMENMTDAEVKRRCGPGAVWGAISLDDMRDNIWLEIEAGTTGKPNQVLEIQNFQQIGPQLKEAMIASGLSLVPLIKEGVKRLGDSIDVDDFLQPAQMPMMPVQNQIQPTPAMTGGIPPGQVANNLPAPQLPTNTAALANQGQPTNS